MDDRELIELAAKAAGLSVLTRKQAERDAFIGRENASLWIRDKSTAWNPLTSDGDAFGLMARLGLDVQFSPEAVEVVAHQHARMDGKEAVAPWAWESLLNLNDPTIATRRAIVRAAAALATAPAA